MCKNEQKPDVEPCYEKNLKSRKYTRKNQELRSWSHVHEKKNPGVVSLFGRLRSPE